MFVKYIERPDDFTSGKVLFLPHITDEIVGIGRVITPELVMAAYHLGIFPWFDDDNLVLWWMTNPRMVLKTENLQISHSLKKRLKQAANFNYRGKGGTCKLILTMDRDTGAVMDKCASISREGQDGTWITNNLKSAYLRTRSKGFLHSIECYLDGELRAGLYGCSLGRMFYGESMFTELSDLSKIAFSLLVTICRQESISWIDCQQQTSHLASLGALPVPLVEFKKHLEDTCTLVPVDWSKYKDHALNPLLNSLNNTAYST